MCRRWLRDEQLAEDAAQETFLRAWLALPHYRPTGDFRSWLRRIARNHCHDLWRAQHDRTVTEVPTDVHTVYLDDPTTAHVDTAAPAEEQLAVRELLQRLNRRDAAILLEHHAFGVPVRALARRWELTRGSMEVALHRARRRARRAADGLGLRGLAPLAGLRRVTAWMDRTVGDVVGAPASASALGHLVVAAAVVMVGPSVTSPTPLPDLPAAPSPAITTPLAEKAAGAATTRRALARDRARTTARRGTADHPAGRTRPADDATVVGDPAVPLDAHMPTGPDPAWEHEGEIGIRHPTQRQGIFRLERYEADEQSPTDPAANAVFDSSCPVARHGEPVTYCGSP